MTMTQPTSPEMVKKAEELASIVRAYGIREAENQIASALTAAHAQGRASGFTEAAEDAYTMLSHATQRAVSWHEVEDCLTHLRARAAEEARRG